MDATVMIPDLFIHRTVMTIVIYTMANYYTYCIGTSTGCHDKPLHDVMHDILPDMSRHVHWRDIVLLMLLLPFLWVRDKMGFLTDFCEVFMLVIFIKAVCIFFTYVPPSNPDCHEKKYLNHCYHSQISGHAAFVMILAILYLKYSVLDETWHWLVYFTVFMYCIMILVTRAHYTTDVISSIIVTWLLVRAFRL